MALQPDGKILIAGTTITNNHRNIALIRYNPNGTLDTTFGTNGTTTTNPGDWNTANAIVLQPNAKILIAGTRSVHLQQPRTHDISVFPDQIDLLVTRYNPDGTLDTTFGTDGATTIDFGGWDRASSIALQTDSGIIVAGTTITNNTRNIALVRYNPNGTLGTTFGTNGTTTTDLESRDLGQDVALQSPTYIIVIGTSNDDVALIRYGLWSGTFSEDDDSMHESAIESLAAQGILVGCDTTFDRYCPYDPITRADVAVVLARSIGNIPDTPAGRHFSDIADDAPYKRHVAYLADLGVTRGCDDSPPRFCPDLLLTRAQAAIFLVRAFGLERIPAAAPDTDGLDELRGSGARFTDIDL